MKLIYLFFFVLILSCSTVKKEYVCGDHLCVDKKEFNDYFSKNFIVEIKSQTNKKNKDINLVNLNTKISGEEKINNKNLKKNQKIKLKEEKEKEKLKKIRVLEERKIAAIKKRNKEPKEKKTFDFFKSNKKNKTISPKIEKTSKKKSLINSSGSKNVQSVCVDVKDCDINKITELLIKQGKEKPFPNITSN